MNNLITIDGPSGVGKTTVALLVGSHLGLRYIPSGKLFRAMAYVLLQKQIDLSDEASVAHAARNPGFVMTEEGVIEYKGQDITNKLHTPTVGAAASAAAQNPVVRQQLLEMQHTLGLQNGCVIEGRSTGIEIFPEAGLKIWLTADDETRWQRKLQAEGPEAAAAITRRDKIDSTRQLAPTAKAPGAIVIDTTVLSAQEVADSIIEHYLQGRRLSK